MPCGAAAESDKRVEAPKEICAERERKIVYVPVRDALVHSTSMDESALASEKAQTSGGARRSKVCSSYSRGTQLTLGVRALARGSMREECSVRGSGAEQRRVTVREAVVNEATLCV